MIKIKEKLVIADDNDEYRREFREYFSDNFEIIEASNGHEVLEILNEANSIELVILDLRMPGMNGIDVLKKIRDLDKNVIVLILTGYGSKDTAIKAFRGSADDYIEKSMDFESIREMIENKLLEKGELDAENLTIDKKISMVKRYIRKNLYKKITLQNVSNYIYISPKYLSRLFKKVEGISFKQYKLKLKMEDAKEMLRNTGMTIEQISNKFSYMNVESFSRIFKKLNGINPSEYRHKKRRP